MSVRQLKIDGITVPVWASAELQQVYERIESVSWRRTANGTLVERILWQGKLRTRINSTGPAPSGLRDISTTASFELWCIQPLEKNGGTSIAIPTNRRADSGSEPLAFAEVGTEMLPTAITNIADIVAGTSDTATIQSVSGASQYQVRWFPVLTVRARPIKQTFNRARGFSWELEAEEV